MAELVFAPAVAGLVHLRRCSTTSQPRTPTIGATATTTPRTGTVTPRPRWRRRRWRPRGHHGEPRRVRLLVPTSSSKYDIQVRVYEDNVLVMKSANNGGGVVNGKRKREEEEDCRYSRLESRTSPRSFVPKFRPLEDADEGAVAARCENGVLTVTIKKQPPPEKKTKSVQVAIA